MFNLRGFIDNVSLSVYTFGKCIYGKEQLMALSIRNPQAEKLAKEIIAIDGGNVTQVIINALQDKLDRLRGRTAHTDIAKEIMDISSRCSSIPDIDKRDPDEILGYNSNGINNNGY